MVATERLSGRRLRGGVLDPLAENYRQVLCAVLYRAVRDLESSKVWRASSARRWLQSDSAARIALLTGSVTREQLVAYVSDGDKEDNG